EGDAGQFSHPRILAEIETEGGYDPALFDQFNLSTKKAVDPVETAVKMTKLIKDPVVKSVAAAIAEHESIDDLYKDKKALQDIFNTLKTNSLIGEYDMPQYFTERGGITGAGEDLLENALLGAVLNEDNIRALSESKGLRRKLARALPQLIENRAMGKYSVIPEANEAVRIAAEVERNGKTFKNVEEWAAQKGFDFMEQGNRVAIELARLLEGKDQSGFAFFMGGLNAALEHAANSQADIFAAGIESKEDIVERFLGLKAEIEEVRAANNKIIASRTSTVSEQAQAALDNAGIARSEADGTLMQTLFQPGWHGSPYRFDRFDSSHMGEGEGAQVYGWGTYFAGKKEVGEYYRETLSRSYGLYEKLDNRKFAGRTMGEWYRHWETVSERKSASDTKAAFDRMAMIERLMTGYDYQDVQNYAKEMEYGQEAAEWFKKTFEEFQTPGQLYEVDIPGDEVMLDWDKPISQQFKQVKNGLRKIFANNYKYHGKYISVTKYTGKQLYNKLCNECNGKRDASALLKKYGIKGIRYLDQLSRGAGEGSYNYVIFDDGDIQITQTFFQLDEQLLEEAAEFDSWQGFRDAKEPDARISQQRIADSVMPRQIRNYAEAEEAGKKFSGKELTNRQTGMAATVSNKTLGKMLSVSASEKSVSPQVHALAVGNVDALFERAELLGSHDDTGGDTRNIKQVHRFGIVMQHNEEFYPVKITVKEFVQEAIGTRIYTVEAVDIEKAKPAGQLTNGLAEPSGSVPIADFTDKLIQMLDSVKNPPAIPSEADNAWYKSFWADAVRAKKGRGQKTFFQEDEEKPSRARELDRRFAEQADRGYLTEALKEMHNIVHDRELEPLEGEGRAEYDRVKRLQGRIRRELPLDGRVWIGIAAQVASGGQLSSSQYDRLKREIARQPGTYRALLADIMNQEEFLEDLAETKNGETTGGLANPRPDKVDIRERLKEIGRDIGDPELQEAIENGEITEDDPRIAAYEKGEQAEQKRNGEALKALETEIGEDFARLANDAKREIVKRHETMLEAGELVKSRDAKTSRMIAEGKALTERYQKEARLEQASYDRAMKAYTDLKNLHGIEADVREILAKQEARSAERVRQAGIRRRMRALRSLKEIKFQQIKRIARRYSFANIAHGQGMLIKAIQRLLLPSLIDDGNRWIGSWEGPLLREVWYRWSTDKEQYRGELLEA
ncbi:MAG: hypothetical protein FWH38_08365, partial [Treponema sp.]|nr:hypothetical protein [Treponema sp.]